MERIDKRLIDFLEKNPSYFSGAKDEKTVREDLRKVLESYARAYDSEAYERLKEKVYEFNAQLRAESREQMALLFKEKEQQTLLLREAEKESEQLQKKFDRLCEEMRNYRSQDKEPVRSRPRTDYISAFLDILGIGFLYGGLILTEETNALLVLVGLVLLLSGLFLYMGKGEGRLVAPSGKNEAFCRFQSRFDQIKEVWAIKKLSIQYRMTNSRSELLRIDEKIERCLRQMSLDSD